MIHAHRPMQNHSLTPRLWRICGGAALIAHWWNVGPVLLKAYEKRLECCKNHMWDCRCGEIAMVAAVERAEVVEGI